MSRVLLVDLGNSRIKWAMLVDGRFAWRGVHGYGDQAEFETACLALEKPDRILASNVAGEKGESALPFASAAWNLPPDWLKAQHEALGVSNCYAEPQSLGPDRWASMIAAHAMQPGECLIISAGTAMTIDWLRADGHFAGGMIIPGARLMREALAAGTARVKNSPGQPGGFSCNTTDAAESGIAHALSGAANRAYRDIIETSGQPPACLISGGDSDWLVDMLDFSVKPEPDLVLKGLALIAMEKY